MAPVTFLEYVMEQLLGPPIRRLSDGESYWPCVTCSSENLHTLPHRPEKYKDYAKCWSCGVLLDLGDVLRVYYPGELWPQHKQRIEQYKAQYAKLKAAQGEAKDDTAPAIHFLPRGRGRPVNVYMEGADLVSDQETSQEADAALAELLAKLPGGQDEFPGPKELRDALASARAVLMVCSKYQLHPQALANRCAAEAWYRSGEVWHLSRCKDPSCNAIVCRRRRGQPPLTGDEAQAIIQAAQAKRSAG